MDTSTNFNTMDTWDLLRPYNQQASMDTSTNFNTMQPMAMFCGSDSIQPAVEDHTQALAINQVQQSFASSTCEYHQNQSWPSPTQGFKFSGGASSSSSMVLPQEEGDTGHLAQPDDLMTLPAQAPTVQFDSNTGPMITMQQVDFSQNSRGKVLQQHVQNSYHDTPSFSDDEFVSYLESSLITLESEDALSVYPPESAIVEQNHLLEDEPSPRRRRVSMNQENNQWNGPQHVEIQESNHHSGTDVQMVAPMQFMLMSNQESDLNNVHVGSSQTLQSTSMDTSTNFNTMQPMAMFCGSDSIQPAVEDHTQALAINQVQQSFGSSTCEYHQNQSWPSPTQGFKFSGGASSSSSMVLPQEEDDTGHLAQPDDLMTLPAQAPTVQFDSNTDPMITMQQVDFSQNSRGKVLQQHVQNSYHDTPSFSDDEFVSYLESSLIALESEDALSVYPPEC
nr:NAC domain-containing protein [Tanacetum cinerariifolium]